MKKSIIRRHLVFTVGFGILMGCVFPLYASFFVDFKSQMMFYFFVAGCLLAGILVGVTAHLIMTSTILRVVKKVSGKLKALSHDGSDLNQTINIDSHDAVGELAGAMNAFLHKLHSMTSVIECNINQTAEAAEHMDHMMQNNINVHEQILESVHVVNKVTQTQIENFGTMESALQILNQSIVIVVANILNLYAELDGLTTIMMGQSDLIDRFINEVGVISRHVGSQNGDDKETLKDFGSLLVVDVNTIANDIQDNLSHLAKSISIIGEISEKTNIMSINTSIEAARAGEFGKGFSIIAAEIRGLSDRTDSITKTIKEAIGKMDQKISDSSRSVNDTRSHFENLLKITDTSLNDLGVLSGNMKSMTDQINNEYKGIGGILIEVKQKIENLKTHSTDVENYLSGLMVHMKNIRMGMDSVEQKGDSLYMAVHEARQISREINNSMKSIKMQIQPFLNKE